MSDRYEYRDEYDEYEGGNADPNAEEYYDEAELRFESRYPVDSFSRRQAALRRRNILFGLVGTVFATGAIGMMASIFWVVTLISFILLIAYVGLMAYAATRGSISISTTGMSRHHHEERHVARAVIPGYGRPAAGPGQAAWQDEFAEYDQPAGRRTDPFGGFDDDGWWDEPRQAVAR